MDRSALLDFLRKHKLGVQASVSPSGAPQAAVVGVGFTSDMDIVFDTLDSTRKIANLAENDHFSFVVGWDDDASAQIEGLAAIVPAGPDGERFREAYFAAHPDGRERLTWKGLVHVRVRPTWIRFSDFRRDPPLVVEWTAAELAQG